MGLDLTVREQVNFSTNEKGQRTWQVVELFNFRKCNEILNKFNWQLEGGFDNGATHSFYAGEFVKILDELKEDLQREENRDVTLDIITKKPVEDEKEIQHNQEFKQEKVSTLKYEIGQLEEFLKQEDITDEDDEDRSFEVHAWW